jgi:hypothetical protein
MSVWRCRVCEGVNQGGRVCSTCGAVVPAGEPLRAAVRTRLPSSTEPAAPPPVPSTPRRSELRSLPTPEQIDFINRDREFSDFDDIDIRPLPGGCLISFAPRRNRGY